MNTWFQFKQFKINQDRCAMKVGTDGVLLGTWLPVGRANRIVDMGTGTGLISLILAQRSSARITAVESDMEAAMQAAENFASSPWPERLECMVGDVHEFSLLPENQFDLAVCNPPYFPGDLLPPDDARSKARHMNQEEDWIMWLTSAFRLTAVAGKAAFVIPSDGIESRLERVADAGFYTEQVVSVSGNEIKKPKRVLLLLSKQPIHCIEKSLAIETHERGIYTDAFKKLVKDFYLNL